MNTFKNLLIFLLLVFVQTDILASDEFLFIPKNKITLGSVLSNKKPKKEFPYRQIASFYPIKALANYMLLGYERQIGPKQVLKLVAGYTNFEEESIPTGFNNDLSHFSGTRFDIMVKYFMGKDPIAFNGLYVAPYFSFKNSNFKYDLSDNFGSLDEIWEDGTATCYSTGFILGIQLPVGNSFSADLYVGNAIIKSSGQYKQASRFLDSYRNSIGLISGFSVGFGF